MKQKLIFTIFIIFLITNSTLNASFYAISEKPSSTKTSFATNMNLNSEDNSNSMEILDSDSALILRFEPPPTFPDEGYFTYSTYNPNTEASLVTSFDTSGYIGDTIASDDAYYTDKEILLKED